MPNLEKMPEVEKSPGPTISGLIKTTIGSVAALSALGYREIKRQNAAKTIGEKITVARTREFTHARSRVAGLSTAPNVAEAEGAVGRLAQRAAKAKTLGAVGVLVSAPGMIFKAAEIEREGGPFEARLGKYVEELLGMPKGATGRGMTDEERRRAYSM